MRAKERLDEWRTRYEAFASSPTGARVQKWAQRLLTLGIVGYLVVRFSQIGWGEILRELPTNGWFYAIFLLLYATLPVSESVIYRIAWGTPFWRNLPVFIKKRVYNKDFLGYSGEAYLFAWARRHVALPARRILGIIKDNVVLSGFGSTVFAVVLLAAFLAVGNVEALGISRDRGMLYFVIAAAALVVLGLLGTRFRGRLFSLPGRVLVLVFGLHFGRLAAMNVLQVVQWDLVIPEVGWQSWFVFLAAQVVISRLPLLPARDLLFLGASVELAVVLGIPRAAMAGMLVALSALDKALNLVLFVAVSALDRRDPLREEAAVPAPDAQEPAAEPDAAQVRVAKS